MKIFLNIILLILAINSVGYSAQIETAQNCPTPLKLWKVDDDVLLFMARSHSLGACGARLYDASGTYDITLRGPGDKNGIIVDVVEFSNRDEAVSTLRRLLAQGACRIPIQL